MDEFRPLEEIADDQTVQAFDWILLRGHMPGGAFEAVPVIYIGVDEYVSDGSCGLEKGEVFRGIRVFHKLVGKPPKPAIDPRYRNNCLYDREKGLLIPFKHGTEKVEYVLLAKSND